MAADSTKPKVVRSEELEQNIICRYYLNGYCKFGNKCKFSHNITDATSQICQFFQKGHCRNGDECRFLHIVQENLPGKTEDACNSQKSNSVIPALTVPGSWVDAKEFIPGQKYTSRFDDDSYSSALKVGLPDKEILCSLAIEGQCLDGESCPYLHGLLCDMCNFYIIHPTDDAKQKEHKQACYKFFEEEMKDSFKIAQTNNLTCGICMEKVSEKSPPSLRRFGILENCTHVFCLDCIRTWRSANNFQKKVVKSCPECRTASSFVTPSSSWVDDKEEKTKMIEEYKQRLSKKPCKYFNLGKGKCPFARHCFYLHAYPDGSVQDKSRLPIKRTVFNQDGRPEVLGVNFLTWLDGATDDYLFSEVDDFFDFYFYDSSLDSETEFDFNSIVSALSESEEPFL